MSGANVQFPLAELTAIVDAAQADLLKSRRELLENIGIQLLSFSQLAYDVKATGARGDDGIQWAPIQVQTVLARLRRAGHIKAHPVAKTKLPKGMKAGKRQRAVYKVTSAGASKKATQNKELFDALHAAGLKFHDKKTGEVLGKGKRNKTGAVISNVNKNTRRQTVDVSGYDIGVDTGLQRAAATPRYKANVNQVFDITEETVDVGYGMSYSKFFDRRRKLMPDVLPDDWLKELEEMAAQHGEKVSIQSIRESGGS